MLRSEVIATCLHNMGCIRRISDCRVLVRQIFICEFPEEDFARWDCPIASAVARNIIRAVGNASQINVRLFIIDLDPALRQRLEKRKRAARRVKAVP